MQDDVQEVRVQIGTWQAARLGAGFAFGALFFPLVLLLAAAEALLALPRHRPPPPG